MIIKGNTVGTPMPRTDWNQTDPKKADYLKGKEDLEHLIQEAKAAGENAHAAAGNAHTAAGNAQQTADNAVTAAGNAQTAADNAHTAADNAQTSANKAMTAAGNAQTTADNAQAAMLPKDGSVAMSGNLQMGNNRITGLGFPEADGDGVNKAYADGKTSMELLWENASPTSNFAAQTVSLNLSGYDAALVEYLLLTSQAFIVSAFVKMDTIAFANATSATSGTIFQRVTRVTESGVTFEEAYNKANAAANNSVMIPQTIYGIKGVATE